MTVQKVVAGEAVRDAVAVAPRAAEMLAELHRCAPPIGARQLDPLRQASATAGTITALVPHLSGEVTGLVEALSASRPTSELVMSHGDFHPKQLLDTADGLTLLDFDEMGMSSAANDMATYVAHLHDGTPVGARRAQEGLIGLIDGYGHRPPDLDWHLSTALLRRAVFPFRTYPGPDWPERIEAMVRAAQAALAQGHLTEMPA